MSVMNVAPTWEARRLRDSVSKLVDGSHNPPPKQDAGVPMLSARNIDHGQVLFDSYRLISEDAFATENARTRIAPGDVLLTIVGTIGRTAVVPAGMQPFSLQRSVAVLSPKPELSPKFLCYQLQSPAIQRHFEANARGTAQKGVYLKTLGETPISFPSLSLQHEIVAEIEKQFSRLDEAIANLKRVKVNLKRYKAAVLKAAVEGRLVPTEAELARRAGRSFETGTQLLQRILETRRSQWSGRGKYTEPAAPDTTDLPELPEGWMWAVAEQLSDFITKGTTPAAGKLMDVPAGVQFLKVYNLTFDGSLNHTYKPAFVSRETHDGELLRSQVVAGDVLINIVGPPLGQVSLMPEVLGEANINQAIARFRPVPPLSSKFLAHALMTESIMSWAIRRSKTTAGQSNLTLELCRALPIPVPPLAEQERIVAEVDRRLSLIRTVEAEVDANLKRSQSLRQAILAAGFSCKTQFTES